MPLAPALLDGWIPLTSPGMTVHRLPELPMFATFFHELKAAKVPVTLKEYLTLMEALEASVNRATASRRKRRPARKSA